MECGGATRPGAVLVYLHCREKLLSQVNVLPNTQAPFREHMGGFFCGGKACKLYSTHRVLLCLDWVITPGDLSSPFGCLHSYLLRPSQMDCSTV